ASLVAKLRTRPSDKARLFNRIFQLVEPRDVPRFAFSLALHAPTVWRDVLRSRGLDPARMPDTTRPDVTLPPGFRVLSEVMKAGELRAPLAWVKFSLSMARWVAE